MVLIIGATGFIGMYTTQAFLKAGKQVIATGRNEALGRKLEKMGAEFLPLDLTNFQKREWKVLFYWQDFFRRMQQLIWIWMRMQRIILRSM